MNDQELSELIRKHLPPGIDFKIINNDLDCDVLFFSDVKLVMKLSHEELRMYPQAITQAGLQIKRFYEQDADKRTNEIIKYYSDLISQSLHENPLLSEPLVVNQDATPYAGGDFYYDLFEGGYIKPHKLLISGAVRVKQAMFIIQQFQNLLKESGLIEES